MFWIWPLKYQISGWYLPWMIQLLHNMDRSNIKQEKKRWNPILISCTQHNDREEAHTYQKGETMIMNPVPLQWWTFVRRFFFMRIQLTNIARPRHSRRVGRFDVDMVGSWYSFWNSQEWTDSVYGNALVEWQLFAYKAALSIYLPTYQVLHTSCTCKVISVTNLFLVYWAVYQVLVVINTVKNIHSVTNYNV